MKIAIIGSRDFNDYPLLRFKMKPFVEKTSLFISGGARGADKLGEKWADKNNIEKKIFLPEWDKYGKRAGFVRNELIINEADLIIAFWDGKSRGTKNSIDLATKKNKQLIIFNYGKLSSETGSENS